MGNIRHYGAAYVEVIVGDFKLDVFQDRSRFAEPLDAGLSQALREVHAIDMPGAEKLRAVQALMRVTDENHCRECGGDGSIPYHDVDPATGIPCGETKYDDCPSCTQFRDVWDPMLGVFVRKAL